VKLAVIVLALSATCFAAPPCKTKDVSGNYAFLANGSVLGPASPIGGPFMRIGSFNANGSGAIHFSTLAIYNGINFGEESFDGTYSVTSDCAIELHIAVPTPINANVEFRGQIALKGNDVTFMLINTDDPTKPGISTVVGFGRQRLVPACSAKTLEGGWRMELNGTRNLPPFGTGTPYRQVGRFLIDGAGGFLATFITSNNGNIAPETAAGTYTVSPDCTFNLNYSIGSTPYSIRGSVISSEAFISLNMPGPAVPGIGILTGAVATGTMQPESDAAAER
jgi:hypothetical protein